MDNPNFSAKFPQRKSTTKEWRPLISRSCLFERGDEDPFIHLKISSAEFLEEINERGVCPECHRSRMYFCYTCLTAVDSIRDKLPQLKLPVQIAIVKHAGEVDGKSTAAHLPVLAPEHVRIYTFPDIPAFNPADVLLLFPGENAQPLERLWEENQNTLASAVSPCVICGKEHIRIPWKTLIFIDSTWKQTRRIYLDAKMQGLPCAVLEGGRSSFWRPQRGKPSSWLATAEAVHMAVTRLLELQGCAGHVDDLLFFFRFFHAKIRSRYRRDLAVSE
ncbi:tRNA-uridine aminocarboxypropyltransferase 1 [Amblyomma americanum]